MSVPTQAFMGESDKDYMEKITKEMEAVGDEFVNAVRELMAKTEKMDSAVDDARKDLTELANILSSAPAGPDTPSVDPNLHSSTHTAILDLAVLLAVLLFTLLLVRKLKQNGHRVSHRQS